MDIESECEQGDGLAVSDVSVASSADDKGSAATVPLMTAKLAAGMIPKLTNTLWAMAEKTRLNRCRKAIAQAFDFDGAGAQQRALPGMAAWKRGRCANHLADNMSRPMPLCLPPN